MVRRRAAREPIAYILGEKEFWSLPFAVGPAVLIPRPESESVVEAALAQVRDRAAPLRLLDLGTGSGCLLLALLSELPQRQRARASISAPPRWRSPGATPGASGWRSAPASSSAAGATASPARFDLIVSNPPYVAAGDLAGLEPEVRAFEPALALSAGPDGLAAYRALIPDCARLLAPGGSVALEIGQGQAAAVAAAPCGARARGHRPAPGSGRDRALPGRAARVASATHGSVARRN